MEELKRQELQLQLMQAKVGMPPRYPYTNIVKEMNPMIGEKRLNEIRATWNGRRYDKTDVELLIKICKQFKDSLK